MGKFIVQSRDKRRNLRRCTIMRYGLQHKVAIGAAAGRLISKGQIQVQLGHELAELIGDTVAVQQRHAVPQELPPREVPIASQDPSVLTRDLLNQDVIAHMPFISSIVPEYAKPACQLSQHRVGKEDLASHQG